MFKNTIWQNTDLRELEVDIKNDLANVFHWLDEEELKEIDDYDISEEANKWNNDYLDDEKENLNIPLNGDMLVIADMGLWNGRKSGYKLVKDANLNDCLNYGMEDYTEVYSDGINIVMEANHHDGTNFITFRKVKKNISQKAFEEFLDKIYNQDDTFIEDINKFTMSIAPLVNKVYGWEMAKGVKA